MSSQATKVIEKFGGEPQAALALGYNISAIYKWNYPRHKGGSDGLIPSTAMKHVLDTADVLGIDITLDDLDPRT